MIKYINLHSMVHSTVINQMLCENALSMQMSLHRGLVIGCIMVLHIVQLFYIYLKMTNFLKNSLFLLWILVLVKHFVVMYISNSFACMHNTIVVYYALHVSTVLHY